MDSLSAPLNPGASTLDRLTLLCALGEHIQRARHVDVIFRRAVEGLSRVLEADGSALLIRDEGLLRVVAACGAGEKLTGAVDGFAPWDSGARDPEPVVVADVHGDARVASVRRALLAGGVEAVACLPLLHRSRLIGEILLFRGPGRPFVAADIEYSTAVAGQLALAISRSRSDAEQVELLRRFEVERTVLESVVKQMPAGVLLADVPSGRVIMSNAQVEVMWGRPLHVHSAQISDYASWRGRDRDGRRLAAEDWPLARSVLYGETVRGEEIEVERADGTRISVRMSSAPVLDSQGRRLAAVATVDDAGPGERAAVRAGAGGGPGQVELPGGHVPRVPDAAERDPRLRRHPDRPGPRRAQPEAAHAPGPGEGQRAPPVAPGGRDPLVRQHGGGAVSGSGRPAERGRWSWMPRRSWSPSPRPPGSSFRVEVPESVVMVRTDHSKVRQIVINLVSNALKYTPEGQVEVALVAGRGRGPCT
jgi:PAS domain-containing protein